MDTTRWFVLPDGRLRAGWRLLLFVVFLVAAMILFQGAVWAFFRPQAMVSEIAVLTISIIAGLAAVVTATWLMMSAVEHQPFSAVGLGLGKQTLSEIAVGVAGGATLVGAITGIEWVVGAIHFQHSGAGATPTLIAVGSGAGIFALSAMSEELLFRGYPFQRLIEGTNAYAAVALSSIVFGTLHIANPYATHLAVANTALAGVLLAVAYLKTRALWLPIGLHFFWNWSLALLGMPISGAGLGKMPWQAIPASPHVWLHGGEYGPEGGVVATVVLVAGIVCLIRWGRGLSPQKQQWPTATDGDRPSLFN